MLSKNVNNKKSATKLIFFNGKTIEKYSNDFWHRKSTLKVELRHFLTPPLCTNCNNFLLVCYFLGKNIFNFEPPVANSTTCITIFPSYHFLLPNALNSSRIWTYRILNICFDFSTVPAYREQQQIFKTKSSKLTFPNLWATKI